MSAYTELYIEQGADFDISITLEDDTTNSPLNVAGYTGVSSMRRSYESANISANLVVSITDAANGVVSLSLDAANTANIVANRYLFDLKVTSPLNVVSRILEGIITVTPQITRS